jgi:hypothetical protein
VIAFGRHSASFCTRCALKMCPRPHVARNASANSTTRATRVPVSLFGHRSVCACASARRSLSPSRSARVPTQFHLIGSFFTTTAGHGRWRCCAPFNLSRALKEGLLLDCTISVAHAGRVRLVRSLAGKFEMFGMFGFRFSSLSENWMFDVRFGSVRGFFRTPNTEHHPEHCYEQ